MLGEEERLGCEICVDGVRLEKVSEFKYLTCILNELGATDAVYRRNLASERKFVGGTRSLVNARVCNLRVRGCYMRYCLCLLCCMA